MPREPIIINAGYDSDNKPIVETIRFDNENKPIFQDFLSDGKKLEHGIAAIDTAWRENKLADFYVLEILEQISGKKITYPNKMAIVNMIVGSTLDIWQKTRQSKRIDNIFNNVKTIQAETVADALAETRQDWEHHRHVGRIQEMDKYIKHFAKRDEEWFKTLMENTRS